jgi:hypothetical protein
MHKRILFSVFCGAIAVLIGAWIVWPQIHKHVSANDQGSKQGNTASAAKGSSSSANSPSNKNPVLTSNPSNDPGYTQTYNPGSPASSPTKHTLVSIDLHRVSGSYGVGWTADNTAPESGYRLFWAKTVCGAQPGCNDDATNLKTHGNRAVLSKEISQYTIPASGDVLAVMVCESTGSGCGIQSNMIYLNPPSKPRG